MKQLLNKSKANKTPKYLLLPVKAPAPVKILTGHLIRSCLTVMLMLALMMTSYAQTQTGQQTPLTVPELKKLLRQSLDREKVLNDQLDAALKHVDSLEAEINDRKAAKAVDTDRITNLEKQKAEATTEITELRASITELRDTISKTRAALDNAEAEVKRQKEKVKAANRRAIWAALGGIIFGGLVVLATQK